MRFDHAIIAVINLEEASADFEALGFTVIYGGEHGGGLTHNALISFTDGSYIEIMAPTDPGLLQDPPEPRPGNYLFMFDAGEGYSGFCLHTDELDEVVERVRNLGIEIADPASGGRLRTDGVQLAWRAAFPLGSVSPFFMTDDTPRKLRVRTEPDLTTHANGALGITRVLSLVSSLDEGVARYSSLLGVQASRGEPLEGAETARFEVGGFEAVIAAPVDPSSPMGQALDHRGEGLFQIEVTVDQSSDAFSLVSHGARIDLVN